MNLVELPADDLLATVGFALVEDRLPSDESEFEKFSLPKRLKRNGSKKEAKIEFREIGRVFLTTVSSALHEKFCGDDDVELMDKLASAQTTGVAAVAALIAGVLEAMGLSAALVAAVSAAIAVSIFEAGAQAVCEAWRQVNEGL